MQPLKLFQRRGAVIGQRYMEALFFKIQAQQLADVFVVIHNKDLFISHTIRPSRSPPGAVRQAVPSFYYNGQIWKNKEETIKFLWRRALPPHNFVPAACLLRFACV